MVGICLPNPAMASYYVTRYNDVFVMPHGDDEAIACAEAVWSAHHRGHHVTVIYTTDCGYRDPWRSKHPSYRADRQKMIRDLDMKVLGAEHVLFLSSPDGTATALADKVSRMTTDLARAVPTTADAVWTISPTVNTDHQATYQAVTNLYGQGKLAKRCYIAWSYADSYHYAKPTIGAPVNYGVGAASLAVKNKALQRYADWFRRYYPERFLYVLLHLKGKHDTYTRYSVVRAN